MNLRQVSKAVDLEGRWSASELDCSVNKQETSWLQREATVPLRAIGDWMTLVGPFIV